MDFDWHDAKSEANLEQRGFDFEYASRLFERQVEELRDHRHSYGEERIIAFGFIEGRRCAVIYTLRDATRWIITASPSRERELRRWRERAKVKR